MISCKDIIILVQNAFFLPHSVKAFYRYKVTGTGTRIYQVLLVEMLSCTGIVR
jgi:hypothetical protein